MKRSISRFRKSPFTSYRRFVNATTVSASWALAILAAASCQLQPSQKNQEKPLAAEDKSKAAPVALFDGAPPARVVRFTFEKSAAFEVSAPPCDDKDRLRATLTVSLPIMTYFGEHRAALKLASTPAGELVQAEVETRKLRFQSAAPLLEPLLVRACAALAQDVPAPEVALEAKEHAVVRQWAEQIAPDCKLDAAPSGFFCNLPAVDPAEAEQELVGVRTAMIRSWSRQPYLISRRVAVGIALAQALRSGAEKDLDKFCNVARHSLKKELPATLASARWLAGACTPGMSYRKLAAQFGLAKTLVEIDVIRQLYERTSKLGSLAVRIPEDMAPAKTFLVSLTPAADVTEALAREAVKLVADDNAMVAGSGAAPGYASVATASVGANAAVAAKGRAEVDAAAASVANTANALNTTPSFFEGVGGACWHPVFAEDAALLHLARTLAMAGPALHADCDFGAGEAALAAKAQTYFAESLTSETEFVVSNGRATTLRLPVGNYSYALRALPDDAEAWDDAAQAEGGSKGQIVWDARRPRPVIATW